MEDEKMVKGKDVAEAFGCDPATIARWRRLGIIPCYGGNGRGHARYLLSEVRAALANQKEAKPKGQLNLF